MILTESDIERYMSAFDLPEERRPVLRVIVQQANERVTSDAQLMGPPSVFLRAAAYCAVLTVLCRQDKVFQQQAASSYWSLVRLHKQIEEDSACSLH